MHEDNKEYTNYLKTKYKFFELSIEFGKYKQIGFF